ncbi:MAG TPA: mycofactocin biosynthesis glycosyltransferase MftF [Acidimicrobiales bacterium]
MSDHPSLAPIPVDAPIPQGTAVRLDDEATFLDRDLLCGGSPWRLLRLPGGSKPVAQSWVGGGEVRAGEGRFARTLVQQGLLHPIYASVDAVDDVDVIIPVHDDVSSLRSLLAMLDNLHVTVVDDGSPDQLSVAKCAKEFKVDLVRLDENRGPGAARNAGVRATSRPLLWFLDVDVVIDNPLDVLARLQAHFADPLEGAVAPRICGAAGDSLRDRFERGFSPLDVGLRSGLVVPNGAVNYVPSACLVVRRVSFGEGFDETLRVGEDVDFVWRLHDHGWLVRFVADVTVGHRARSSWGSWWSQRVRYGQSSSELAKRHGERLAPLRVDAWTLVAWSSALVGKPTIGLRILNVARNQLRERLRPTTDDAGQVAGELVGRGMVRAGPLMARATVRTFGIVVLLSALHPKWRRRALTLFVVGTAYRWRSTRVRALDIPLGVADDVAYGVGVMSGAVRSRTLGALTPHITKSTLRLRTVLGLPSGTGDL